MQRRLFQDCFSQATMLTIMLTITQATMLKKRKHKMKRCNTEPQVCKYNHTWIFIYLFVCVCLFVRVCLFNTEPQVYKYKYILELLHISLFVCACVCLSVCSTQGHRDINIYQRTHISMYGQKVPHAYTGCTFRIYLKWFDFSKLFASSKILEFLSRRCWHYHFVLLHRQPSQTPPHHRFFQSPVSNCPRSLCLCLIRYSFFYDNW